MLMMLPSLSVVVMYVFVVNASVVWVEYIRT